MGPYGAESATDAVGKVGVDIAGASFGLANALLQAVMHTGTPEASRYWEQAMPRTIKNVMAAWRMANDGEATTLRGEPLVQFDLTDPADLAAILGQGLGAPPTEVRQVQEQRRWAKEQMAWLANRREGLLTQFWTAVRLQDAEGRADVLDAIKSYNQEIAALDRKQVITRDTLLRSVRSRRQGQAMERATGETTKQDARLRNAIERLYGLDAAQKQ
jgi:hypothetical protein